MTKARRRMLTPYPNQVSVPSFQIESIKPESDYKPFTEWRVIMNGMTKEEAKRYYEGNKNMSPGVTIKMTPEFVQN